MRFCPLQQLGTRPFTPLFCLLFQGLFGICQKLLYTIGKVQPSPVGQNSQPPYTFPNFRREFAFFIRWPAPFMTHSQPSYQAGIGQKGQGIFLDGPFGTMIFPFQCMISCSDSSRTFRYFL